MDRKLTSDWEVLTPTGYQSFSGIKKTTGKYIQLNFDDGTHLECSYNHKILVNGNFIEADKIEIGTIIESKKLINVVDFFDDVDLYDLLEVENGHTYYTNDIPSSNCAFIRTTVWNEFFNSTFPTISSGKTTKCIMVSTPNGQNHFYDIWNKAVNKESDFEPFEVNWWDVPGRDEEWKRKQIANTSLISFEQEYGNSFAASSNTLVDGDILRRLSNGIKDPEQYNKNLKIYELPEKSHTYIATVDVADEGIDLSTISVIDITEYPWKQVAVYRANLSYLLFPQMIVNICVKYNKANVLVEKNETGKAVLHVLNYELDYDNVISTRTLQKESSVKFKVELGQRTTVKTKSMGCATLKVLLENGKLQIFDKDTVDELKHFELNSKGSYSAEPPYHDDIVMGLVNFAYYSTTSSFEAMFDTSFGTTIRSEKEHELEESLCPLPLFGADMDDDHMSSEDRKWLEA
jgi:hypothetical protein